MKKRLVYVLGIAFLLMAALARAALASGSGTCGDGLTWTLSNNGKLIIMGAGEMDGYSQTNHAPWYTQKDEITSVEICEGVSSIGVYAFCNCRNLKTIELPSTVLKIGAYAFTSSGLISITIPDGVSGIEPYTFSGCKTLQNISIPGTVTYIGYASFNNTGFTSITLPESIISVEDYAFNRCSGLADIYYKGSEYNWGRIRIGTRNDPLKSASMHYNSVGENDIPSDAPSHDYLELCLEGRVPESRRYHLSEEWQGQDISVFISEAGSSYVTALVRGIDYYWDEVNRRLTIPETTLRNWKETRYVLVVVSENHAYLINCFFTIIDSSHVKFEDFNLKSEETVVSRGKYLIQVMNAQGIPLSGAKVTYASQSGETGSDGKVLFDLYSYGDPKITVQHDDYLPWTNQNSNYTKSSEHYETIILYTAKEGNNKLSFCLYSNNASGTPSVDILTHTKTVSLGNDLPLAGDFNDGKFYVSCGASGSAGSVRYELWQKKKKIADSSDGYFSLNADSFSKGGNCFIRVYSDGNAVVDTHINLEFKKSAVNKASSISLDGGKISFPVEDGVPFLGGSKFDFNMPVKIPLTFSASDDGKLQIGVNVNVYGGKSKEEQLKKAKKLLQDAQKAGQLELGKLSESQEKAFKSLIDEKQPFKLFQNGEINVLGYLEGDFAEKTAKGQIMIQGKIDGPQFGFTTWVVVVPVTANIKLSLEGGISAEISYDWEDAKLLGDLDFSAAAKLKAFGGVGVGKAIGVGAYGSAKLSVLVRLLGTPLGPRSVDLTGELGLKAYIAWFEYERPFAYNTWYLYTGNTVHSASAAMASFDAPFDASAFRRSDLNYLDNESAWNGESISLFSADASTSLKLLLTGTYRNAQPVAVAAESGLYAAFLRADAKREEVYAVVTRFDGASWREPVRVDSAAVLDDAPQLLTDKDGTIWLTYARTKGTADRSSMLDTAKNQEIVVGRIDPSTLAFSPDRVYSANGFGHMQMLAMVDGIPTLAWVDSTVASDNDVLLPKQNAIHYAQYKNGTWSNPVLLANADHPIRQLTAGGNGIACNIDMDGDMDTAEDARLMLHRIGGQDENLANGVSGRVSWGTLPGTAVPCFVWNDDGCLKTADGKSISAPGLTGEYALTVDRLYYSAAGDEGAHLTTVLYEGGSWSDPVTLTGGERYLENLSVLSWQGNDYVLGMDTLATITSAHVTDDKNLVWATVLPASDLRLDDITYDTDNLAAGEPVQVTLHIKNVGDHVVEGITVKTGGKRDNLSCSIAPGEMLELKRALVCPESLTKYEFTIHETGMDDFTPADNSASVWIGYPDLAVKLTEKRIGDYRALEAVITNEGVSTASGTLRLLEGTENKILERDFGSVAPGDAVVVTYELEQAVGSFAAAILCDGEDLSSYNDESHVSIASLEPVSGEGIIDAEVYGTRLEVGMNRVESGFICCAEYNGSGKLLSVQLQSVAANQDDAAFTLKDSSAAYRKVFLLNERFVPQCNAKEIR